MTDEEIVTWLRVECGRLYNAWIVASFTGSDEEYLKATSRYRGMEARYSLALMLLTAIHNALSTDAERHGAQTGMVPIREFVESEALAVR